MRTEWLGALTPRWRHMPPAASSHMQPKRNIMGVNCHRMHKVDEGKGQWLRGNGRWDVGKVYRHAWVEHTKRFSAAEMAKISVIASIITSNFINKGFFLVF